MRVSFFFRVVVCSRSFTCFYRIVVSIDIRRALNIVDRCILTFLWGFSEMRVFGKCYRFGGFYLFL